MKFGHKVISVFAILFFLGAAELLAVTIEVDENTKIDSSIKYNIHYVISSYEINILENVQIAGFYSMGNVVFLIVQSPNEEDTRGYILLSSIKAMVPAGVLVPQRTIVKPAS